MYPSSVRFYDVSILVYDVSIISKYYGKHLVYVVDGSQLTETAQSLVCLMVLLVTVVLVNRSKLTVNKKQLLVNTQNILVLFNCALAYQYTA